MPFMGLLTLPLTLPSREPLRLRQYRTHYPSTPRTAALLSSPAQSYPSAVCFSSFAIFNTPCQLLIRRYMSTFEITRAFYWASPTN